MFCFSGASSGIGEGIAVHFASLKCRLSLAGRSQENLDRVARLCHEAGLAADQVRERTEYKGW